MSAWRTKSANPMISVPMRLGAYYDMGAFRVTGLGQWADLKANGDVDTYGVGLRYKMGKAALKGQYYWVDTDGTDADANMMAIGVDYSLDKSTKVYMAYARTDNDDNADSAWPVVGTAPRSTPRSVKPSTASPWV
jgi:predicted porin